MNLPPTVPPWNKHPELTEERLCFIGTLLKEARNSALDIHDIAQGERNWSLGCRVLERNMFALIQAATDERPWLQIINSGRHFVFSAGGVPLRFYTGAPGRPPERSLRRRYPELRQQQLAFPNTKEDAIFRIAVETDMSGRVVQIVVVETTSAGEVLSAWPIPFDHPVRAVSNVTRTLSKGVELDKPRVGKRKAKKPTNPKTGTDTEESGNGSSEE